MNDLGGYLQKRAAELGLDRAGQLTEIQAYLETLYPGQCRALSLNDGVLRITTPNSSVASELRLRQREIITAIQETHAPALVTKLILAIASKA